MDFKKAIGFGLLLWVIIFVVVSVFIAFDIYNSTLMHIITAIIAGAISLIFANYLKPKNVQLALSYSLSWVIIAVILDAIITMRFNSQIFMMKSLWLGYALVLLTPLLRVKKSA